MFTSASASRSLFFHICSSFKWPRRFFCAGFFVCLFKSIAMLPLRFTDFKYAISFLPLRYFHSQLYLLSNFNILSKNFQTRKQISDIQKFNSIIQYKMSANKWNYLFCLLKNLWARHPSNIDRRKAI